MKEKKGCQSAEKSLQIDGDWDNSALRRCFCIYWYLFLSPYSQDTSSGQFE